MKSHQSFLGSQSNPNLTPNQFNALWDFYNSTHGDSWRWLPQSAGQIWNFTEANANPCFDDWQGCTCHCLLSSCNLTRLTLPSYNLSGVLPSSIAEFHELNDLNLGNNSVSGSIPSTIGNLTSLSYLLLNNNRLTQMIPSEIWKLTNLTFLNLANNFFIGSLPTEIKNLVQLRNLLLSSNMLSGTIPSSIGTLIQLNELSLDSNQIHGTIPTSIQNLVNLTVMNLGYNQLNGSIPFVIGNLPQLVNLNFEENALTGTIPSSIRNLTKLTTLNLYQNHLVGQIPPQLGNLQNLSFLQLGENNLRGPIPSVLGNLYNLTYLDLDYNYLNETIPSTLGNLKRLQQLHLYNNQLTGTIPTEIVNCRNLTILNLYANLLNGTIPSTIGNLDVLTSLNLFANFLTGSIPKELGKLKNLINLKLYSNRITGVIPNSILELSQLQDLNLHLNYLNGTIPSEIGQLQYINYLNLRSNRLNGTIPSSLGRLSLLTNLYLYDNFFTGTIPSEICHLKLLQALSLFSNQLTGSIPIEIGNLTALTDLEFYSNSLNGTIPSSIGELFLLETFDLNSNFFSGSIPSNIGNDLSFLTDFDVRSNLLNGTIPRSIGNMTMLNTLYLYDNLLTGKIPLELGNLQQLTELDAHANLLTGTLPSELGNLKAIGLLDFYVNQLHGTIPDSIGNLTTLYQLELQVNHLSGRIPASFANLKHLGTLFLSSNSLIGEITMFDHAFPVMLNLDLSNNFFTGSCEQILSFAFSTETIVMSSNLLTGSFPIQYWHNLLNYILFENYFAGTIPNEFISFPNLALFLIGNNYANGMIPKYFLGGLLSLLTFNVSTNLLTGPLVSNFSNQIVPSTLQQIIMNNNYISGTLPMELSNAVSLTVLSLTENELTGTVPLEYKELKNLEQLFLASNKFHGSMSILLNSVIPFTTSVMDLSDNQFSGSLAGSFFKFNTNLTTFAAVSNCLSGSIPSEICEATNLTALALDGISTTKKCREYIFPGTKFNGFLPKYFVTGTIPTCLFAMPHLQSLHLSGNGFTGSLPSSLVISESLTDLSLSHNSLSGTIISSIQNRPWTKLDLSYNKFTGTLSNSIAIAENESLSLEVNRLSGTIPNQLVNLPTINLLNGNIFECTSSSELPRNDPSYVTYSCGSSYTNDFLYSWLACGGMIGLLFLVLLLYVKKNIQLKKDEDPLATAERSPSPSSTGEKSQYSFVAFFLQLIKWHETFVEYSSDEAWPHLVSIGKFFQSIRYQCALFCFFSIFCLLPLYSVLTIYTHSYSYEYAWTVSAVLLSGETAALVLFVTFLILSILFYIMVDRITNDAKENQITNHSPNKNNKDHSSSNKSNNNNNNNNNNNSNNNNSSNNNSNNNNDTSNSYSIGLVVARILVLTMDAILFGSADLLYVFIVITYDVPIIIFATIALAACKLIANNIILWRAIPSASKFVLTSMKWFHLHPKNQQMEEQFAAMNNENYSYLFTLSDVVFLERLMLFNNIFLPILAILIILSDCFYNVFVVANNVTSSYSYNDCAEIDIGYSNGTQTLSNNCIPTSQQTSYSPPFIYSYQCSSKVLINYAPVYVMKFVFIAFLRPIRLMLLKYSYDITLAKYGDTSTVFQFFDYFLPEILKRLQSKKEIHQAVLYPKLSFTTQLSSYLAIIMVFGGLFPPLAFVGYISIMIMTYYEEILIGRLLHESSKAGYDWYREQLDDDCKGINESFNVTFKTSLFILCCFYFAYVLFDTWGDQKGWQSALPITLLMASFPIFILLFNKIARFFNLEIQKMKERAKSRAISMTPIDEKKFNNANGNVNTNNPIHVGKSSTIV